MGVGWGPIASGVKKKRAAVFDGPETGVDGDTVVRMKALQL